MIPVSHLLGTLILLTLTACSKENYIYIKKQSPRTDQNFRVKELKGSNSVDVIWVIDNSGSMYTYQQQVIDNAKIFMKDFIQQKLNWKMGLISTDQTNAPFAGFSGSMKLDSTIADPVGVFASAVSRLGTNGSGNEETFVPIIGALTRDRAFLRTNTPVAFIMVTDAQEQSNMSAPVFLSQLTSLTQDRNIFSYGVYASADLGCRSEEGTWNYKGSVYEEFINAVFVGQVFPICKDFGTSLANIAHDIVTRVSHTAIYLSGRPDTATLQVMYQDQALPAGPTENGGYWIYDYGLNAVVFNNLDFAKNDTDSVRIIFEELH